MCVGVPAKMFERAQQTSFLMECFSWLIRVSKLGRTPAYKGIIDCSSEAVEMLPMILRQGIVIAIIGCDSSSISLFTTPVAKRSVILSSPPSVKYVMPQHPSIRISASWFWRITLAIVGIILLILSYAGWGLPLQKFERHQVLFLRKDDLGSALSVCIAIKSMQPELITMSLTSALVPAKLPRPHMACSTISLWGEFNRLAKPWIGLKLTS